MIKGICEIALICCGILCWRMRSFARIDKMKKDFGSKYQLIPYISILLVVVLIYLNFTTYYPVDKMFYVETCINNKDSGDSYLCNVGIEIYASPKSEQRDYIVTEYVLNNGKIVYVESSCEPLGDKNSFLNNKGEECFVQIGEDDFDFTVSERIKGIGALDWSLYAIILVLSFIAERNCWEFKKRIDSEPDEEITIYYNEHYEE